MQYISALALHQAYSRQVALVSFANFQNVHGMHMIVYKRSSKSKKIIKLNMIAYLAISSTNLFTNIKLGDRNSYSYDIPYTLAAKVVMCSRSCILHFTTYPFWLAHTISDQMTN